MSSESPAIRHLAVLKNVGIIADEKRGVQVFYRLQCRCVTDFAECVEAVMKINAKNQQRMLA